MGRCQRGHGFDGRRSHQRILILQKGSELVGDLPDMAGAGRQPATGLYGGTSHSRIRVLQGDQDHLEMAAGVGGSQCAYGRAAYLRLLIQQGPAQQFDGLATGRMTQHRGGPAPLCRCAMGEALLDCPQPLSTDSRQGGQQFRLDPLVLLVLQQVLQHRYRFGNPFPAQRIDGVQLHVPPVVPLVVPGQILRTAGGDLQQDCRYSRVGNFCNRLDRCGADLSFRMVPQELQQRGDRLGIPDAAQRLRGVDADIRIFVVQPFCQCRKGLRGLQSPQGPRYMTAIRLIPAGEQPAQHGDDFCFRRHRVSVR